ncbi:MAG: hypothetical protein Q8P15_01625 [Nanoarchaeota archaeon]|nr:hypothetical protein [Nanoarchaeota archaeon]
MTSFLWHRVSENEKEDIEKQAKEIMDSFSKKLDKVGKVEESFIERKEFERSEGGKPCELDREIMFENAPNKNNDFIIGERKGW